MFHVSRFVPALHFEQWRSCRISLCFVGTFVPRTGVEHIEDYKELVVG